MPLAVRPSVDYLTRLHRIVDPAGPCRATRTSGLSVPAGVVSPVRAVHPGRLDAPRFAFLLGKVGRIRRVAQPTIAFITVGPLQQRLDVPDRVIDALVHVAQQGEVSRHRGDGELLSLDIGQLVPPDRRGYRSPGFAAVTPTQSPGRLPREPAYPGWAATSSASNGRRRGSGPTGSPRSAVPSPSPGPARSNWPTSSAWRGNVSIYRPEQVGQALSD